MKKATTASLFSIALLSLSSGLALAAGPQHIQIAAEKVFAPPGFDSNDNTQVVLHGHYPSTCFRSAAPTYQVNPATNKVTIQNNALYYESDFCLQMLVPYVQVVELGLLQTGTFDVYTANSKGEFEKTENVTIAQASTALPDETLYAVVDSVSVQAAKKTITIRGKLTNTCMSVKEIKVLARKANIVEVLPIVELADGDNCRSKISPFEASESLKDVSWAGETLFHVRSMNGQAVNKVFEL